MSLYYCEDLNNMKKETLKSYMVRDKAFLRALYVSDNILKNKRLLNGASDIQLNTLLGYLHFLTTGEIKINKKNFDAIKPKIKYLRKNVETKTSFSTILNGERPQKIHFLLKLYDILPNLLYGVFNLP